MSTLQNTMNTEKVKQKQPEKSSESIFDAPCTLFEHAKNPKPIGVFTVSEMLTKIQDGTYKTLVSKVRKVLAKHGKGEEYTDAKKKLLAVILQGRCTYRRNNSLKESSGFLTGDLDGLENPLEVQERLKADPYVAASFISPSEHGLKPLVRIPFVKNDRQYKAVFKHVAAYFQDKYGLTLDEARKDVAGLCFVSHDPHLYRNESALVFPVPANALEEPKPKPKTTPAPIVHTSAENNGKNSTDEKALERVFQWKLEGIAAAMQAACKGSQHETRLKKGRLAGGILAGFGSKLWTESQAVEWLMSHYTGATPDKARSAIQEHIEYGKNAPISKEQALEGWEKWKQAHPLTPGNENGNQAAPPHPAGDGSTKQRKSAGKPGKTTPKPATDTKQAPGDPPVVFWDMAETRKGFITPKLNRRKFLLWLESAGFGLIRIGDRLKFVQVTDNVVRECLIEHGQNIDIKRHALNYCRKYKLNKVENMLLSGHFQYFTLSALNTLQYYDLNFCRDTQQSAFLFFRNVFVEVQRERVSVRPYSDLKGYVWEDQILPYDYTGRYTQEDSELITPTGDFYTFFECVTAQNVSEDRQDFDLNAQKIEAFLSAYGYLLYGWKDVTESKAVICVDNSLGDIDDDGRTGKSLFCESLKHLKNVRTEAGKTWNPEERFAFQNVDVGTQTIFIDDITRKFNFKALYPSITGDMSCEGKGQKPMPIPFAESAKFVLTSNTPIQGEGDSDKARQCVLPFSRFFSLTFTPKEFFGHRLFVDWTQDDWQEFFDFAIYSLIFYLKTGLLTYEDSEFQEAKLKMQVPEQVVQVCCGLERDVKHDKNALLKSLEEDGLKIRSSHQLTKWLKIYTKYWKGTTEQPEKLHYKDDVIKIDSKSKRAFIFEKV